MNNYKGRRKRSFTWLDYAFQVWTLSLPFQLIPVFADLSFDNLLAPVLVLCWLVSGGLSGRYRTTGSARTLVALLLLLFLLFGEWRLVVAGRPDLLLPALKTDAKIALYLMLPLLFVTNGEQFRRFFNLMAINGLVVAFSGILFGLGLIEAQFGLGGMSTRLNVGIERSLGLVGGSGPFAILTAVSLLALRCAPDWGRQTMFRRRSIRWFSYALLLGGILASQSRNVFLVSLLVLVLHPFFISYSGLIRRYSTIIWVLVLPLSVVFLVLAPILYGLVYEAFSTVGGEGTIQARLAQYETAWSMVVEHPMGVPLSERLQAAELIASIHSIWFGVLLKGGVLGLVCLLLIIGVSIKGCWERVSKFGKGNRVGAAVLVFAIVLPVSGSFFVAQTSSMFWAALSLTIAYCGVAPIRQQTRIKARAPPTTTQLSGG